VTEPRPWPHHKTIRSSRTSSGFAGEAKLGTGIWDVKVIVQKRETWLEAEAWDVRVRVCEGETRVEAQPRAKE